jgi:predicted transcriptional regulator
MTVVYFNLSDDDLQAVDALADMRFDGNRSEVLRQAALDYLHGPSQSSGGVEAATAEINASRDLLAQSAEVLTACWKAVLTVRPALDHPYPEVPELTPYTRWLQHPTRAAHDLAMTIRKHLLGTSADVVPGEQPDREASR